MKERIGRGLSGSVIRAEQTSLSRDVAVKFFDNSTVSGNMPLKNRFIREAKILAKIQHPSIPYVITYGEVNLNNNSIPYTVMQYINGSTLDSILKKRGSIGLTETVNYLKQILNTLSCVHNKNVLHRDIKPSNIIVQNTGHCFLIDFSIGANFEFEDGETRLTKTGNALGTYDYVSPEQAQNSKDVDKRTDIYSIGVLFFEMLTGHTKVMDYESALVDTPQAVKDLILKACKPNREERLDSADDFLQRLDSIFSSRTIKRHIPGKAVCINTKCPEADWSPNGYYRKPSIINDSTENNCVHCGSELIYNCEQCNSPFEGNPFCGNCGSKFFNIPKCEQCGSLLQLSDMGKNTSVEGCSNCPRRQRQNNSYPQSDPNDIPF